MRQDAGQACTVTAGDEIAGVYFGSGLPAMVQSGGGVTGSSRKILGERFAAAKEA